MAGDLKGPANSAATPGSTTPTGAPVHTHNNTPVKGTRYSLRVGARAPSIFLDSPPLRARAGAQAGFVERSVSGWSGSCGFAGLSG